MIRSDPLVADIDGGNPISVGDVVPGGDVLRSTGTWRTEDDGGVFALERAGSLTWRLDVPESGADALSVRMGQHEFYSQSGEFDVSLYVDGVFVCRQIVNAPYGSLANAYFFLPEISAGSHEIRLVWRNWDVNTFLVVKSLQFVRFDGPDDDGNGVPDWKDARRACSSALGGLSQEGLVSPLCVEGRDLWRDVLEVSAVSDGTQSVYAVTKTVGDGFYVDVPLAEDGSTRISLVDRALSNSFDVVWRDFDVFDGEYETNALVVRVGDSLKIANGAGDESLVSVSVAGESNEWTCVTNWLQSAATPFQFENEGSYRVEVWRNALGGEANAASARVDVVRSRFSLRNPVVMQDRTRDLACPGLSPRNLLEHDEELDVSATNLVSGGVGLSLHTSADRDLGLVSRLGEGEAISDAVRVTPVWADNGSYYHVTQTYPDGSQLVEVSLLLGAITDEMSVTLTIFVAGVTFEDGTRTKVLSSADFDEDGHCTIRFLKARGVTTSVCHRTAVFQNGEQIYTN